MGGHHGSINRAFSLRTYTKPFSSKREFLNTAGRVAEGGVSSGTSELLPEDQKGALGLLNGPKNAGDIVFGNPPPQDEPVPEDTPAEPLPGTEPSGAAPNPTASSEMAALKRRRMLRMGLLSTITTSPGGLPSALPNLLTPAASSGQTLLG